MKKTIFAAALAAAALAFAACPSPDGNADKRVSIAAIPGVPAPATGQAPVTAIEVTDQYTGAVSWSPQVTGTFAAATPYTATITLAAHPGFTFAGVAANSFTVAGATSARNARNSGVVIAAFPATGGTVTAAAIPGVTPPATGQAPVTTIGVTDQYTGTVSWSPQVTGTFAAHTVYTATITLAAHPGYTFDGLAAGFFTVAGATPVGNAANSGVVTAAFPATGAPPVPVTIAAIPGVTAPAAYATPVAAITETAQYTGTVAWSPEVSGVFDGETAYTATITLTAKAGFTFSGVAAGFFTTAGAAWVGNAANSGTVMATFPQTGPLLVIEMEPISAGTFIMGSPTSEPGRNDDETQHTVTLTQGFSMGKYQVTQAQYETVLGANPSDFTTANGNSPAAGETDARRPVETVSWYDAIVFCNRLSMGEGLSPAYSIGGSTDPAAWGTVPTSSDSTWNAVQIVPGSSGYRLPTEAQWEYACRAGTDTPCHTASGTSSDLGDYAWGLGNSSAMTHEVGKKLPNAWGLHDMHGNVHEWCWDWYGSYFGGAQTDPSGAASGSERVLRGGSLYDGEQIIRSAHRGIHLPPNYTGNNVGFRLVRP